MTLTITSMPIAVEVRAANASGGDRVNRWLWSHVPTLQVGDSIFASGGGELFSETRTATVVWRDDQRVVVEVVHDYREDDREPTRESQVLILHLRPLTCADETLHADDPATP